MSDGDPDAFKMPQIDSEHRVSIRFSRQVATAVGITALGVVLLAVATLAIKVLLTTFAGVLLGIFLLALRDPLARRTPLSPGWSLVVVLIVLLALLVGGGLLLAPELAEQADEFSKQLPEFTERAEQYLQQYAWGRQVVESVREGDAFAGLQAGIGTFFSATTEALGLLVTFFVVGFFVAVNPGLYYEGLVRMMPLNRRARTRQVLEEIGTTLRWFLVARAIAMTLVGVLTAVSLTLLDIPLALFLGVLAGLLTFIPYLGPIIAGVPIIVVALLQSLEMALYALVVYTAIQQLEGNIFDPLILQKVVRMPPVITLISQILGATLLGILGITLATPFVAALQVVVRRVYREDVLGEPPEEEFNRRE